MNNEENNALQAIENIIPIDIYSALGPKFLNYAMSVITDRALPDVRDGLKPVHRRIMYSMYELGIYYNKPYKKCARTVGDVLGKYHPHGDASVYDAMVILAQEFATRYPLVDGHGNFGSVDGDGAAAMRYTEARLSRVGQQLLNDISKDTVDFMPNYDGEEKEPRVLPTLLPLLLMNGTFGIAVGMATNIPPHNLKNIYSGCYKLIEDTKAGIDTDIEDIINCVYAPDFPTGGQIMGISKVKEMYRNGVGKFVVRGKHETEETKNGSQIVITEIPFKVNKAKLVESIIDLAKDKKDDKGKVISVAKIKGIKEVRDESDKEGMRIVVEVKKDENPNIILNNIIKYTEFQKNISARFLALVNGEPKTLNIKEILNEFLAHSASVILRRTQFDLDKDTARLNLVEGILKCIQSDELLSQVINIVRTADEPVMELLTLGFNQAQAEYIYDMKIRSLSKASAEKLNAEKETLETNIEKYYAILNNESVLLDTIAMEFRELEKLYGDDRLTEVYADMNSLNDEDLIKDETLIITFTTDGIIKAVEEKEYKSQKRGGKGVKAANTKDDEIIKFMFTSNSKDDLLLFTTEGRCHVLKAYKINKSSKTAKGKSINNYINLNVGEKIVSVLSTSLKDKDKYLLFITKNGQIKKLSLGQLSTRLSVTRVIKFKEGDSLVQALLISEGDNVLIVTANGMSLRIDTAAEGTKAIRPMGRDAAGVTGINVADNDKVVDMCIVNDEDNVLTVTEYGIGKRTKADEWRIIGRGGKGVGAHGLSEKTGKIIAVMTSHDDDELFIATEQGLITRISNKDIRICSRTSQGVRVINLNNNDKVASVSINKNEESENTEE